MWRRFFIALLASTFVLCASFAPTPATAAESTSKGLYISPLRSYLSIKAGDSLTRAFTVANLTEQTMNVQFHVEQFSVTDYAYDYRFTEVDNDWVQLVETSTTLKPYESREVPYRVSLPSTATPGGHYYTLYASSTLTSGESTNTVQVAMLLYMTIEGELVRTSQITKHSLPSFVMTPSIAYSLDIKNTGNTHYFALVSARVDGLFYHDAPNGTSQLLMPGTTRAINASITSPLLPGIYKLTYTIAPDQGAPTQSSHYFLYAPLWCIVLLVLLGIVLFQHLKKRRIKRREMQT